MKIYGYHDGRVGLSYSIEKDPDHFPINIHLHDSYELYCFISGNAKYMIEGREVPLEYGTVLLMRPGELHTSIVEPGAAYERYVMNFYPTAIPEEFRETLLRPFRDRPLGEMNVYRPSDFPGVTPRDLLATMCIPSGDEQEQSLRMQTLVPALLTLLLTATPRENRSATDARSVGVQMVDFVNSHLCDPVSVSMVAEEFFMSVSQVSRIFKAATGTTVGQYGLTKRLLKARRRILGGTPAQQAARECGFGCYSSFYRLYKKKFGASPSEEGSFDRPDNRRNINLEKKHMIRSNYHTHTTFSDGKNTPEEMIEAAIALGFEKIGISDHAYTAFYDGWSIPLSRMEEYIRTLRELKEKYKGRIDVYVGLEQDAYAIPVPEGLDYYLGSVHWLKKGDRYIELDHNQQILREAIRDYYGGDADAFAEDYFDLVASYADDPKVGFIGHFDLITKFDEKEPPLFLPTPRYTAAWQKASRRLIDAGKIFEINTGAISRGKRVTPYPSEAILEYWGKHGAKVVICSDCHSADTIDCAFARAEELAEKYGVEIVDLF